MKMIPNDKMERLLDMIEHPEKYSEVELKELLSDDECRAYYELMVKTDNAFTKKEEVDVEDALRVFEQKHIHTFTWRKLAAIFIGILVLSGLAYATITLTRPASVSRVKTEAMVPQRIGVRSAEQDSVAQTDTIAVKEKTFDNVELQVILDEVVAYYQLKVVYQSEVSKHLRLHFSWDKSQDIETVIETLNHFEKVNLTLTDGIIQVK